MPRIFLSFRKIDDRWMRERVFQALVGDFGPDEVFKSGVSIPPGAGYAEILRRQAAECDLMLVLIGAHWLDAADEAGRPLLHRDEDWVRGEVATAFQAGNRVVPVLLGDSTMLPSADALPEDLAALAGLQFLRVAETHVQEGLDNMVAALRQLFPDLPYAATPADSAGMATESAEPAMPSRGSASPDQSADPSATGVTSTTTASGTHSTAVTGGSGYTPVATGKHAVAVAAGAGSHISIVQKARTWAAANPVLAVALIAALVLGGGGAATYAVIGAGSPSTSMTDFGAENAGGIPSDPGVGSIENQTEAPSTDPPTDPSTSDSAAASPGSSSSASSPAPGQGTIADVADSNLLMSGRAIAKFGSSPADITFLDPATGADAGSIAVSSPSGADSSSADSDSDVALLDNGADTLVIFVYDAHYPEHELTAARDEQRYQVWSRATGKLTMDALLPFGSGRASIVGVDPSGWAVLKTSAGVIGVPVIPHAGNPWQFVSPSLYIMDPLVVHQGRVLVELQPIVGQSTTLNVLDVSNGRRIRPAMDEPNGSITAGSKTSTNQNYFEVGENVFDAVSGALLQTAYPCIVLDPRQPLCLADASSAPDSVGYEVVDLTTGSALAKVTPPDDSTDVRSFFDGKLYLSTATQQLVVDGRTGAVVSQSWTLAPQEVHDGWYTAVPADPTDARGEANVYPGSP